MSGLFLLLWALGTLDELPLVQLRINQVNSRRQKKVCVCSLLPFSFLICSDSFSLILSFLIYKQAWSLKNPSVAITYVITIRAAPVKKNRERFEKEQRQTKSQSNPKDQSERLKISHRANGNSEQINLNDIKSGKSGTYHKAEVVLNVASDWLRGGTNFGTNHRV